MRKLPLAIFSIFASTVYILSSATDVHAAQCGKLPAVEWWSNTHSQVNEVVAKKYNGDWEKYIGLWQSYRGRMEKLYNSNSVAIVKSRGLKLQGKQLEKHIKDITTRLDVLKCLQDNETQSAGNNFDQMETAAGRQPLPDFRTAEVQQQTTQIAAISGDKLDIEVTARCEKDSAVFQITNLGDKWPRLGEINVYRTDNNSLLSKRRVRMSSSQKATFKIRKRGGGSYGTVGLWVSPSWDERIFKYDAKVTCQ